MTDRVPFYPVPAAEVSRHSTAEATEPTAVAIANEPVIVQDQTHKTILRTITYVVVIVTCIIIDIAVLQAYFAINNFVDNLQQITQTWGELGN